MHIAGGAISGTHKHIIQKEFSNGGWVVDLIAYGVSFPLQSFKANFQKCLLRQPRTGYMTRTAVYPVHKLNQKQRFLPRTGPKRHKTKQIRAKLWGLKSNQTMLAELMVNKGTTFSKGFFTFIAIFYFFKKNIRIYVYQKNIKLLIWIN